MEVHLRRDSLQRVEMATLSCIERASGAHAQARRKAVEEVGAGGMEL